MARVMGGPRSLSALLTFSWAAEIVEGRLFWLEIAEKNSAGMSSRSFLAGLSRPSAGDEGSSPRDLAVGPPRL
jgi:hypothetical protein